MIKILNSTTPQMQLDFNHVNVKHPVYLIFFFLLVMRCWHSKGVLSETREDIKNVIKDDNLSLYWEWYPYNEYEELMEAGLIPDESDEEELEDS